MSCKWLLRISDELPRPEGLGYSACAEVAADAEGKRTAIVYHPNRRGAAFRVPRPGTRSRGHGVFSPNRAVSCGSLERVAGP